MADFKEQWMRSRYYKFVAQNLTSAPRQISTVKDLICHNGDLRKKSAVDGLKNGEDDALHDSAQAVVDGSASPTVAKTVGLNTQYSQPE